MQHSLSCTLAVPPISCPIWAHIGSDACFFVGWHPVIEVANDYMKNVTQVCCSIHAGVGLMVLMAVFRTCASEKG
jgi:cytochrome b